MITKTTDMALFFFIHLSQSALFFAQTFNQQPTKRPPTDHANESNNLSIQKAEKIDKGEEVQYFVLYTII